MYLKKISHYLFILEPFETRLHLSSSSTHFIFQCIVLKNRVFSYVTTVKLLYSEICLRSYNPFSAVGSFLNNVFYSSFVCPVQDPTERYLRIVFSCQVFNSPLIQNSSFSFTIRCSWRTQTSSSIVSLRLGSSEASSKETCPNMWLVWGHSFRKSVWKGKEGCLVLSRFPSHLVLTEKLPSSLIAIGFQFLA